MTIDEVLRIIKDNIYLGIAGAIVLSLVIGVGYFVIYRKLLKGKKKINAKQAFMTFLISGYLIMVAGVTFLNRGAGIYGGFNFNILSSYREAWNNFDVRTWQYLIFNIIMFVPLGFLLPLAHIKFQNFGFTFFAGLILTLLIELLQLATNSGIFDIDDIINNLVGTLMGYSIVMTLISLHKIPKHKYRKAFVYLLPFLIVAALFTGVFTYYNIKEFGNLSANYNYKLNMKNTSIPSDLLLNSEGKVVPIYKAPSLSKELSKEFAVNFFENMNVDTYNLEIIDYHEVVVYWARGGKDENSYNIWLNNIDGSFRFSDYSLFDDDVVPKEATEEVIKENLGYFDINIPEEAKFESETIGDYIFSVDKTVVDNKLIHGVLTCSYYNDETIKNIDNNLVVYEKVKDVAVISEKEAYERITEGKFTYRKDIGVINTIEINEVAADYRLDSKGFFQPVYIFNTLINYETYSIVVPALAK